MRRTAIVLVLCAMFSALFAQSPEFTHTIVSSKQNRLPARDFWLTMPKNYEAQAGKYYELYVASTKATRAHIELLGGATASKTLQPHEVWAFKIPLAWEVTTSGIVEDLGIHVWSNDADLSVNMLSRNPATSDGMNIIPVTAWGTEYVVAAYHALYEGFGTTFDFPSEFSIIAAFDSTAITITPSADIRENGLPNNVLYKKGEDFTITLNRGQVIQFMTTLAQNPNDYDVTGTIVRSSKPIGVVGASQCPNIPPEYPYCDHVCEMIQPVNAWGQTYHTIPFYNRNGGDSFVMIASKNNQTIYRNGVPLTTLGKLEFVFRPDIDQPSTWTSDAPFFLAQYLNSTTYDPFATTGVGDPAMVAISPQEQYVKELLFQAPTITTGTGYTHYANIFVHKNAIPTTTMDGIPINSYPSITPLPVPFSDYVAFRARSLKSGAHLVKSDSGVGVYVYGYGSYDSYAWNGQLRYLPSSVDTVAPKITATVGDCYCANVAFTDLFVNSTGISSVVIDSIHNITFAQNPNFIAGISQSSYYDICIIQPSESGYISISIYDGAGNRTTVVSRIEARTAPSFTPAIVRIAYAGDSIPNYSTFTLTNTTTAALPLGGADGLRFVGGNRGFDLYAPDLSDIAVNATRTFTVRYVASDSLLRRDTIVLGNECSMAKLPLESFYAGPPVPLANEYDFGCILFGTTKDTLIRIYNLVTDTMTIDTFWIDDPTYFKVTQPAFPFVILNGGFYDIAVSYHADKLDTVKSTLRVITGEFGESHTTVKGCALQGGSVRNEASHNQDALQRDLRSSPFVWLAPIPNPADRKSDVRFVFGLAQRSTVTLELFDMLGKRIGGVDAKTYDGGVHEIGFETGLIAAGTYIYRYSVDGKPYSGMLTIR